MKSKKFEEYLKITEGYDWFCTKCQTRHPTKANKCFVCGSEDSIIFEKQTIRKKRKSALKGATLKINV